MSTESNSFFGLVSSGVGRGASEGEGGVVLFAVKLYLACGLMLKKKLLLLMIELVWVMHL